jgi:hypothetical protein
MATRPGLSALTPFSVAVQADLLPIWVRDATVAEQVEERLYR